MCIVSGCDKVPINRPPGSRGTGPRTLCNQHYRQLLREYNRFMARGNLDLLVAAASLHKQTDLKFN